MKEKRTISFAEYLYCKLDEICDVEANFGYVMNVLCHDYHAYDIPYQTFLSRFGLNNNIFDIMAYIGNFDNFETISAFGREYVDNQTKRVIL